VSPPPSHPPKPASASAGQASPPTEAIAAPAPNASAETRADHGAPAGGTVPVTPALPAPDLTEQHEFPERSPHQNADATLVQRLSDRLMSENISRRMRAAGYKLIRELGEGTYGLVWLAEEASTGVRVAIKFFAHGTGQKWQLLQDEVKQLAALDAAAGIVHLKDAVGSADPPYYVMSYAEGGSLAQRLEKGPLPVKEAIAIFEDVVQALAYVHAHGIRHCDLKPGNILLDVRGKPLVADFGQAHLSDDASPALGTFYYMAPEQADLAEQIPDTRWDVYGLGALLYAMLTGLPPRKNAALSGELKNTVELTSRLRRYRDGIARIPKPTAHRDVPGVDRQLARIIDDCLELDPKDRLPSAEVVLEELRRRRVRMRQRPLILVGVLAPLLIILGMSVVGWMTAQNQIKASKSMVVNLIMDDDQAAAGLDAWGMQRGFARRLKVVADLLKADGKDWTGLVARTAQDRKSAQAGDPANVKALADDQEQLNAWLKTEAEELHLDESYYISGLSVVDRDGFMLISVDKEHDWDAGPDFDNQGAQTNWSWRDWFNGRGDQLEGNAYPPVTTRHISQPYKSTDGVEKVDLTVPVFVPGTDGPVAVLVGSMTWAEATKWLTQLKLKNGRVVIFNDQSQLLMHGDDPVLADLKNYRDHPHVYEGLAAAVADAKNNRKSYEDPFDHRHYYVGYKQFDPYGEAKDVDDEPDAAGRWGIVVEHERDEVLKPVEALNSQITTIGAMTLIVAVAFTGSLWWGLIWLLRRQERLGHV
jgi:hypothetical protein